MRRHTHPCNQQYEILVKMYKDQCELASSYGTHQSFMRSIPSSADTFSSYSRTSFA